mmetsp:Transcript_26762/g.84766  ORF Transcript_26762/g.84766 Transcript_26762/m.84766 type:complete len:276 (+) Transcript_26762:143-970(+)
MRNRRSALAVGGEPPWPPGGGGPRRSAPVDAPAWLPPSSALPRRSWWARTGLLAPSEVKSCLVLPSKHLRMPMVFSFAMSRHKAGNLAQWICPPCADSSPANVNVVSEDSQSRSRTWGSRSKTSTHKSGRSAQRNSPSVPSHMNSRLRVLDSPHSSIRRVTSSPSTGARHCRGSAAQRIWRPPAEAFDAARWSALAEVLAEDAGPVPDAESSAEKSCVLRASVHSQSCTRFPPVPLLSMTSRHMLRCIPHRIFPGPSAAGKSKAWAEPSPRHAAS